MKKQIYSDHAWSFKSIITVTILSAMLCAFSAKADNETSVTLNAVTNELKTGNGAKDCLGANTETNFDALEVELFQEVEYNAVNFVNSEMALEFETWMNSDFESYNEETIADITLPFEYNAKDFIDAEMALENQNQDIN